MSDQLNRRPLLTGQALGRLQRVKEEIVRAAAGKVPERLVLATVEAAARLSQGEAAPRELLSEEVLWLVRESLIALAQQKWKPETALLLYKHPGGRHGTAQ